MSREMTEDEREVAEAVADWLAAGDDRVATKGGTLTFQSVMRGRALLPPPAVVQATLYDGLPFRAPVTAQYEIELSVRRKR